MTDPLLPSRTSLLTSDFDYHLPPELIAQTPLERRDESRLLVLDKASGAITHAQFRDLPQFLAAGDLMVANNSRVIPARLHGHRQATGGAVELLLLHRTDGVWSALARPAKRLKAGETLEFPARFPGAAPAIATVIERRDDGEIGVRFDDDADERLQDYGVAPLPPYITQRLHDEERYQTVYARQAGSAAAPTAGLHFTPALMASLAGAGIGWSEVTLHVGLDTFRPVAVDDVSQHHIHQEWCEVGAATAEAIATAKREQRRVVAVGTTSARTLETLGRRWAAGEPGGFTGMTGEFIVPGHHWTVLDALVTNFHLPRSTLLMLVSALAGREAILEAYARAVEHRYRFFSFGDAMLIR
ncbi:MAG: tRNA preQ1(34) S-adenosylmethionine ribosyltransferase-isomerase QueA [Thermomicrobiales bacterium]